MYSHLIPDVENGGLNRALYLDKALPCMTVAHNSIILTTMFSGQNNLLEL